MPADHNPEVAVEAVQQVINELAQIRQEARKTRDWGSGREHLKRWKLRAIDRIRDAVTVVESEAFAQIETWHFGGYTSTIDDIFQSVVRNHLEFLFALKEELEKHPDDVFSRSPDEAKTESTATADAVEAASAEQRSKHRKNTAATGGEARTGRTFWDILVEPPYLKERPWYWVLVAVVVIIYVLLNRVGLL